MKKILLVASILILVASAFAFNPRPFITQLQITDWSIMEYVDVPEAEHQPEFKVQVTDVTTGDTISTDTHHVSLARVSTMPGPGGLPTAFLTFDCQGFPTLGNVPEGREFTVELTYLPHDVPANNSATRTVIAPAGASPVWSYGDEGSWHLSRQMFGLSLLNVTSNYAAEIFRDGISTGFFTPHTFLPGQVGVYHLELDGYAWEPIEISVGELTEDTSIDFVGTPHLPEIITNIPFVAMLMNSSYSITGLGQYFETYSRNPDYSIAGNTHISWSLNGIDEIALVPQTDWYGTEYITIRATNPIGYAEQVVKVTVFQTWLATENFDHIGALAAGWAVQHSGSTTFPWQPVLNDGEDYGMRTMATTGGTANERLLSPSYNLSNYKDVEVSFDSVFLPYGSSSGSFAYTLNNISYTVVETYTSAHNGQRAYTIPALDGKPSVRFRWLYSNSSANTGQSNYWSIDDFSIFGLVLPPPPSPVSGFTLLSQDNYSALLGWDSYSTTYFGSYKLYISTDSDVTAADLLWSVDQDPALIFENTSQTNIDLPADGDYWIAIRAVDQSGNASPLSEPVYVRIDNLSPVITEPIPAGQPEPAWANSRTVTIGCSITDLSAIDPGSIQYRIDANGNGIYDEDESWQVASDFIRLDAQRNTVNISVEAEYSVDGVLAYEFKAADIYGNTSYSGSNPVEGIEDDWVVKIDTIAPLEIANFFVQEVYDDSIMLSWTASADENFAGYRIYYSTEEDVSETDSLWNSEDDPSLANAGEGIISTTITGLLSSTRYYFILQAIDEVGWISQYPQVITGMTTSSNPPMMPQNLALSVSGHDLLLNWDDVTTDTFANPIEISYYEVHVSDEPYFDCSFDTLIASMEESELFLEGVAEFADRLFFKVIAVSGAIRLSK